MVWGRKTAGFQLGVSKFTTVEVRKSRAIRFLTARSELFVCSQPGY